MAAPMDDVVSSSDVNNDEEMCYIEATVATGLEQIARLEALDSITKDVKIARGHIVMKMPIKNVKMVMDLRCVDHCSVRMVQVKKFPFSTDQLESMKRIREFVRDVDWQKGLAAWSEINTFKNEIAHKPDHIVDDLGEPIGTEQINKPSKGDKSNPKGGIRAKGKWDNNRKKKGKRRDKSPPQTKEEEQKEKVNVDKISEEVVITHAKGDSDNCEVLESADMKGEATQLIEEVNLNPASNSNQESGEATVFKPTDYEEQVEEPSKKPRVKITSWDPEKPAFRVTCKRGGKDHSFDSMCAASNFGGAVNRYFNWNVDLKNFDLEVILNIEESEVRVCLALHKESLHKRNMTVFGPTTLRPTIAANMLRLCKIKPGDFICDPLCGTGSIPLEAATKWPHSYILGGDVSRKFLSIYSKNIENANMQLNQENRQHLKLGIAHWDACNLPLRDNCVDVFVTDMPFGIRSGSLRNNWKLYPGVLNEMARVATLGNSRACILSQDKKCIMKIISAMSHLWTRKQIIGFNLGGLAAGLYLLQRTNLPFDKTQALTDVSIAQHNSPVDVESAESPNME